MASWILVACLVQLRTEFNTIAPARAKGADGSIGDTAHQQHSSDHNPDETGAVPIHDADKVNEVHALDITTDLKADVTLEQVVQFILARCRSGAERRLRYIIFNRRIWAADEGWEQQAYVGTGDPHTGHAHFSASYDSTREADASPWHLEDLTMPSAEEIAKAVWEYQLTVPRTDDPKDTKAAGDYQAWSPSFGQVDAVTAAVGVLAGKDFTDEAAIVRGVLAGLSPAAIAAAIPKDIAQNVADELAARLKA